MWCSLSLKLTFLVLGELHCTASFCNLKCHNSYYDQDIEIILDHSKAKYLYHQDQRKAQFGLVATPDGFSGGSNCFL